MSRIRVRNRSRLCAGPTRRKSRHIHFGTCVWALGSVAKLLAWPIGLVAEPLGLLDELEGSCPKPIKLLAEQTKLAEHPHNSGPVNTEVGRATRSAQPEMCA